MMSKGIRNLANVCSLEAVALDSRALPDNILQALQLVPNNS